MLLLDVLLGFERPPPPPFFFFLLFEVAGGGAGLVFRPNHWEFSFIVNTFGRGLTWYCYYRRRDDKGVDFEVGDVWHERPVRPGAVAAVQAGDEVAVAGLKQISSHL